MIKLIENNGDLEVFCRSLAVEPFITVDLEFLREKTYYAKLCLIQVGSQHECAIIDPLASEMNLQCRFSETDGQSADCQGVPCRPTGFGNYLFYASSDSGTVI